MNTIEKPQIPSFATRGEWALHLSSMGFQVVPIAEGTKETYHPWPEWEDDQSKEHIRSHWLKKPNDDIGIFTKNLAVFDADHAASQSALNQIMARHGLRPSITVRTKKGVHEYFLVPPGVSVKQDSHSTEKHPERIDVKAERSYIIGPGSTNKTIVTWNARSVSEMTPLTQLFADDIELHNGKGPRTEKPDLAKRAPLGNVSLPRLREVLQHISPDSGYMDWIRVGMAVYRETNGSSAGLELFNSWSEQGQKYKNIREIEMKWKSFDKGVANPVTMGTLVAMAGEAGSRVQDNFDSDAWFARVSADHAIPKPIGQVQGVADSLPVADLSNPFEKAALHHVHKQLEREVQEQRPFLKGLALLGQSTVIYAAPNTGKTLVTIHAIIDSVMRGDVDAKNICYINADDSGSGLLEKSLILAKHGISMIGDGYNGFCVDNFKPWLQLMIANGQVKGKIFIIDTLTRFFDTHLKGESRSFTKLIGQLTTKGGTFIGLGHTRKNPGLDGRAVYAGTADVVSDFHCVYMLEEISQSGDVKTVEFRNMKRRGDVKLKAAFSYSNKPTDQYEHR